MLPAPALSHPWCFLPGSYPPCSTQVTSICSRTQSQHGLQLWWCRAACGKQTLVLDSVLQLLEGRVPSASQSCSLESGRYMCSRIGVDGLCQTKAFSSSNMWALQVVPSVLPKYSFSCLTLLCASVLEKGTEQRGHGRDTPLISEGWPGVALFF